MNLLDKINDCTICQQLQTRNPSRMIGCLHLEM